MNIINSQCVHGSVIDCCVFVATALYIKREGWVYYVDFVATRAAQSLPLGRV